MSEINITNFPWLLFIATLPGQNGGLRVRFWRQMKAAGAGILRDGVYLLPHREDLKGALEELRAELAAAGGNGYVLQLPKQDVESEREWLGLFDRTDAYNECRAEVEELLRHLPKAEAEARRSLRAWQRGLEALIAIDYFPGEAREQAQRAASEAEARLTRHYSPDEPLPARGSIARLSRRDHQGRRWATRRRPWVDRVASAWLIQRFIDKKASFVWLTDVRRCPKDALGFDFDGASFTHVGDKVTFEVLLYAFALEKDTALQRVAEMVHVLDVGGEPTAEASGFEAVLAGSRSRVEDDDHLLAEMGSVLDSLYVHFQNSKTTK